MDSLTRREFVAAAGAATAWTAHSYSQILGANERLRIGVIGAGGMATAHMHTLVKMREKDNLAILAVCDLYQPRLDKAVQITGGQPYKEYRRLLENKDIDYVVIGTPEHWHAQMTLDAADTGKHIYCEKPLGNTVEETRVVRANYLKNKTKLATQVGTQRHAYENFNRVREMVRDGAIGDLVEVCAWGDRKLGKPGYLPAAGDPPADFHWDLWLGPSPAHPWNPEYFSGSSGMNCLQWNMYWDFGSGQVGDMGSHTMDLAWNAIDADLPTTAEGKGDPFNPDVTPVKLETIFPAIEPIRAARCKPEIQVFELK